MINGVPYDQIRSLYGDILNPELSEIDLETWKIVYQIGNINGHIDHCHEWIGYAEASIKRELDIARHKKSYHPTTKCFEANRASLLEQIEVDKEQRAELIAQYEARLPDGQIELF